MPKKTLEYLAGAQENTLSPSDSPNLCSLMHVYTKKVCATLAGWKGFNGIKVTF